MALIRGAECLESTVRLPTPTNPNAHNPNGAETQRGRNKAPAHLVDLYRAALAHPQRAPWARASTAPCVRPTASQQSS
jgi:hypothetical protein